MKRNSSAPRVSVVILNYAKPKDTLSCIQSVLASDYENLELIVVDNSSSGSISNMLDRETGSRNLRIVRIGRNVGYSGGNNAGLRNSKGNYILILNDDVIIGKSLISELAEIMENDHSIGIIGPIVYRYGTNEVWGCNPRIKELDAGLVDVMSVVGCSLMVRRDTVEEIGLLDENFFLYHEEWDWCIRARKAGYRTVFATKLKTWHKTLPPPAERFHPISAYFTQRNYFMLAAKHCTRNRKALSFLFRYIVYGDRTLHLLFIPVALKNKKFKALRSYLKGIVDGVLVFFKIRLSSNLLHLYQ